MLHNSQYFTSLQRFNRCLIRRHFWRFARHEVNTDKLLASPLFQANCKKQSTASKEQAWSRSRHERKVKKSQLGPPAVFRITCGRIFSFVLKDHSRTLLQGFWRIIRSRSTKWLCKKHMNTSHTFFTCYPWRTRVTNVVLFHARQRSWILIKCLLTISCEK